jgi:signal transduction histidine kinase
MKAPFRARSRVLALLGDQLIGSDHLAIFELVKNAYDADATTATVRLRRIETSEPIIDVVDDGDGMDLRTIRDIWLELANDHRELQRKAKQRTKLFGRLPLGEKGVGRFAVHKLGRRIRLVTRPRNSSVEYLVRVDWDALIQTKYLDQTQVDITTRQPSYFLAEHGRAEHGTRIRIEGLRKRTWKRGDVRQLFRAVTAISSPFETNEAFKAVLDVPDHPEWLLDMPDVESLLKMAPWHFSFVFDGKFSWKYEFRSPIPNRLEGRNLGADGDHLLIDAPRGSRSRPIADLLMLDGIGPIRGSFVSYDRDRKVLALLPQNQLLKSFLEQQGGVRVYREGVRVYNYGEPDDDWLQLDIRRVNRPAQRLSRNIVVGAVNLSIESSERLREKTNREGFDQTEAFYRFKTLITGVIHKFEVERAIDKDRLKVLLEGPDGSVTIPVETPIQELRVAINNNAGSIVLLPLVDRIENEYQEMRDLLLRAGMTGLNLAVIIHEVERGIRSIYEAAKAGSPVALVEQQSRSLMRLIESLGGLLREKSRGKVDIRQLVQEAAEINTRRFRRHHIQMTYELPNEGDPFVIKGSSPLLLNVLTNLIDNSIYWLRVRWPDKQPDQENVRRIFVGVSDEIEGGRSLILADNGPGFQDEPDVVTKPFFTRRPDGTGLGLYYASLAMTLSGGTLRFPDRDDLELPDWATGAVIALQFSEPTK